MRSNIRRQLVDQFAREMARQLSQFQRHLLGEATDTYPVWGWKVAPGLTCFVMLQPYPNDDQFVIEIGWSETGEFPWRTLPSHPPRVEALRFRERLARLWATGKLADKWTVMPDPVAEGVPPTSEEDLFPQVGRLVVDAIQKLIAFGMPVFQQVAEHRGIVWNSPPAEPR